MSSDSSIRLTERDIEAVIVAAQVLPGQAVRIEGAVGTERLAIGTDLKPVPLYPSDLPLMQSRGWVAQKPGYHYVPGSNTHVPKPRPSGAGA